MAGRRRVRTVVIVTALVLTGFASVGYAAAALLPAPTFPQEQAFPPLPSNALAGATQFATPAGLSCPTVGNCVSFGYYYDAADNEQGWIATETDGVWNQATELPSSATQNITGDAIWCENADNCVIAGDVNVLSNGVQYPVTARETNGTWSSWTAIKLPSNAVTGTALDPSYIYKLSCTAIWRCVAVGSYVDVDGYQPMAVTETFGHWSRATEIALPAGASTNPRAQNASLFSVSCWNWNSCVAVGEYSGPDHSGGGAADELPMVVTETGGTWGQASDVTLPGGALTGTAENADLFDVSCVRGTCTAVGVYQYNADNDTDPLVITYADGVWGTGSSITVPAAIAGDGAPLSGVYCESVGNCTTVGSSVMADGQEIPFAASEVDGLWGQAGAVAYPSDASATQPYTGGFFGMACTRAYRCVAFGDYANTTGAVLPAYSASTP